MQILTERIYKMGSLEKKIRVAGNEKSLREHLRLCEIPFPFVEKLFLKKRVVVKIGEYQHLFEVKNVVQSDIHERMLILPPHTV